MDNNTTTNDAAEKLDVIKHSLASLIRHAAISRLEKIIDCTAIEVSDLGPDFVPGKILANHLALIQITSNLVRVTFKCHFNTDAAKKLAFRVFGSDKTNTVSEKEVLDFIKEYCNLVAGKVVALFEGAAIDMGIGLPICTRGFYEVFSNYEEMAATSIIHADFWRMRANGSEIFGSALIEIIDENSLECMIGYRIAEESNTEGEIEFL